MELSPGSLKWPAIYGLTQSLAVVVAGSVIGQWVDRTPRWNGILSVIEVMLNLILKYCFFTAARLSLGLQNLLVVSCAICVAATFYFREYLAAQCMSIIY